MKQNLIIELQYFHQLEKLINVIKCCHFDDKIEKMKMVKEKGYFQRKVIFIKLKIKANEKENFNWFLDELKKSKIQYR